MTLRYYRGEKITLRNVVWPKPGYPITDHIPKPKLKEPPEFVWLLFLIGGLIGFLIGVAVMAAGQIEWL